jgi:hypothetical protein
MMCSKIYEGKQLKYQEATLKSCNFLCENLIFESSKIRKLFEQFTKSQPTLGGNNNFNELLQLKQYNNCNNLLLRIEYCND